MKNPVVYGSVGTDIEKTTVSMIITTVLSMMMTRGKSFLGKTHQEIIEEVHLPHATFNRYLKELSKREQTEML